MQTDWKPSDRIHELEQTLRDVLEHFASLEKRDIARLKQIIEDLKADSGYGYRHYSATVTDNKLVEWIKILEKETR